MKPENVKVKAANLDCNVISVSPSEIKCEVVKKDVNWLNVTGDFYFVVGGAGLEKRNYSMTAYGSYFSAQGVREKLKDLTIDTKKAPTFVPETEIDFEGNTVPAGRTMLTLDLAPNINN